MTCRAAQAIKSVDRMVNLPISLRTTPSSNTTILSPSSSHPPGPHLSLQPPSSYPLSPDPSLPSPLSPGVESVEFNKEEVLKTCQVQTTYYLLATTILQSLSVTLSVALNPSEDLYLTEDLCETDVNKEPNRFSSNWDIKLQIKNSY